MKLNEQLANYPSEYLAFLVEFHTSRDYFRCHDLLEELWRDVSLSLEKDHVYVGLLQVAVAMYHWRRDNVRGGQLLIEGSIEKLQGKREQLEALGIQFHECIALLHHLAAAIESGLAYESPNIPLTLELNEALRLSCEERNQCWQTPSNTADEYLVHRHLYK